MKREGKLDVCSFFGHVCFNVTTLFCSFFLELFGEKDILQDND